MRRNKHFTLWATYVADGQVGFPYRKHWVACPGWRVCCMHTRKWWPICHQLLGPVRQATLAAKRTSRQHFGLNKILVVHRNHQVKNNRYRKHKKQYAYLSVTCEWECIHQHTRLRWQFFFFTVQLYCQVLLGFFCVCCCCCFFVVVVFWGGQVYSSHIHASHKTSLNYNTNNSSSSSKHWGKISLKILIGDQVSKDKLVGCIFNGVGKWHQN